MIREYKPDRWVLVEVRDTLRVMGSWNGDYLYADRWRLSSMVQDITEDDDFYYFNNTSGSIYKCHKESTGASYISTNILQQFEKRCEGKGIHFRVRDENEDVKL